MIHSRSAAEKENSKFSLPIVGGSERGASSEGVMLPWPAARGRRRAETNGPRSVLDWSRRLPARRADVRSRPPKNLIELLAAIVADKRKTENVISLVRGASELASALGVILCVMILCVVVVVGRTKDPAWAGAVGTSISGLVILVARAGIRLLRRRRLHAPGIAADDRDMIEPHRGPSNQPTPTNSPKQRTDRIQINPERRKANRSATSATP